MKRLRRIVANFFIGFGIVFVPALTLTALTGRPISSLVTFFLVLLASWVVGMIAVGWTLWRLVREDETSIHARRQSLAYSAYYVARDYRFVQRDVLRNDPRQQADFEAFGEPALGLLNRLSMTLRFDPFFIDPLIAQNNALIMAALKALDQGLAKPDPVWFTLMTIIDLLLDYDPDDSVINAQIESIRRATTALSETA